MAEAPIINDEEQLQERIARKAYELFEQRGRECGHEVNDWLAAEQMIKNEVEHGKTRQRSMDRPATQKSR
jgi:Protein of unknown function (DUF2934)